jgi:hypothetical protein
MRVHPRLALSLLLLSLTLGRLATCSPAAGPTVEAVPQTAAAPAPALPNRDDSLKFAVLGDFGNGSREQRELAEQMASLHARFPFELVITVGDNVYGSENPRSYRQKFEEPYKPLLDAGVKFHASLGNHDDRELQRHYELFNMGGEYYYTFKAPRQDVRFFALETSYMDVRHIAWLEKELTNAGERWKIPYFHHPIYSSGRRHGSDAGLRRILEPLFLKHDVSVVFAGHDHFYERTTPQNGIVHFVVGSGGELRRGNINRNTGMTASGFDSDQAFLAVEIDGDEMFFNAISRTGAVVDAGVIRRIQPQ